VSAEEKKTFGRIDTSGLYYKHITIVNDASRVAIIWSATLPSFLLINDLYGTGITYDDHQLMIVMFIV
jgi:hypothetical protein